MFADVITVKAEDQTNAILKGNNALAAKQIKDVLVKAKNDLKSQCRNRPLHPSPGQGRLSKTKNP